MASLSENPFFSPAPSAPQEGPPPASLEDRLMAIKPVPVAQAVAPDTVQDVKSSAAAGLTQGATRLPGMFGDMGKVFPATVEWISEKVGASPDTAAKIRKGVEYVNPLSYFPTGAQTEAEAKRLIPSIAPVADYEPKTNYGRYTRAATRELPMAVIPGGGYGLASRTAGALASGIGGEAARDWFKGTPQEGSWKQTAAEVALPLIGGIGGTWGASKIGQTAATVASPALTLAVPGRAKDVATRRINEALQADIATGKAAPGAADILREGGRDGVTPAQLAGPNARELAAKSTARIPEGNANYNQALADSAADAQNTMAKYIANKVGKDELAFTDEVNNLAALKSATNNPNYKAVMAAPEAQVIPTEKFYDLWQKPIFDKEFRKAHDLAVSQGPESGIRPWTVEGPGNLAYWDFIKKHFDALGNYEAKQGVTTQANAYRDIAKEIRTKADDLVPAYKSARDQAAELFGFNNALEMGGDYINLSNKRWDKLSDIERTALNKMSPEDLDHFRVGAASSLMNTLTTAREGRGLEALYNQLGKPEMQRRLERVFGKDGADDMIGAATVNAIKARAKMVDPGQYPSNSLVDKGLSLAKGNPQAAGALAGAVPYMLDMAANQAMFSPNWKNLALVAVGTAYGAGVSKAQTKVAERVAQLMSSPEGTAELGKLIRSNQSARNIVSQMNQIAGKAPPGAVSGFRSQRGNLQDQQEEPRPLTIRPTRARGGAVTAESLLSIANRAKKRINEGTKAILTTPDESVAGALRIAASQGDL